MEGMLRQLLSQRLTSVPSSNKERPDAQAIIDLVALLIGDRITGIRLTVKTDQAAYAFQLYTKEPQNGPTKPSIPAKDSSDTRRTAKDQTGQGSAGSCEIPEDGQLARGGTSETSESQANDGVSSAI